MVLCNQVVRRGVPKEKLRMADLRLGPWVLVGAAALSSVVACVDGSTNSGPSPNENVSNAPGAGASGMGAAGGPSSAMMAYCTLPQVSCNGVCTDLTTTAHCGKCEQACATGQSCVAGQCTCPGALGACNGACVDTQTSVEHCGGCSKPCATGAACVAGVCGCAANQQLCNDVCVDLKQSDANCGACGKACAMGQVCANGSCVSGAGADGCTGGPALGVTLKHIDVFQTVKVPVMDAGAEVT